MLDDLLIVVNFYKLLMIYNNIKNCKIVDIECLFFGEERNKKIINVMIVDLLIEIIIYIINKYVGVNWYCLCLMFVICYNYIYMKLELVYWILMFVN